nr:MAG TPA: hypothetical protein [Caudoviricetes sp.]
MYDLVQFRIPGPSRKGKNKIRKVVKALLLPSFCVLFFST